MEDEHKKYKASVESRISSGKFNMLAMAAPLETSSYSRPRHSTPAETKKVEEPKEIPNQRLGILHALLSVGALRPAIAMISQYPWIVDAHPELCDLIIRILEHSIKTLYERMVVLRKDDMKDFTAAKARWGPSGLVATPERKPHVTLIAPEPPCTSSVDFVFFFPDWTRYIPVCQSEEDIVDVVEPLMKFIAPHVSRGYVFFTKFIRIGRYHLGSVMPPVRSILGKWALLIYEYRRRRTARAKIPRAVAAVVTKHRKFRLIRITLSASSGLWSSDCTCFPRCR